MNKVHLMSYKNNCLFYYSLLDFAGEKFNTIRNKTEIILNSKNQLHY